MNDIDDLHLESARQMLGYSTKAKRKSGGSAKKIIRIFVLAAALTGLITAGAYAAGFLGSKAIVIPETQTESGEALVSITQPQAVPEEMDSEIHAKVENARAAWDEWRTWRETSPELPHQPEVFTPPKDATISHYAENEDGSYTLYYNDKNAFPLIYASESGEPDFSAATPIEVRSATAEEMAAREEFISYVNLSYGDYDFNYDIHNETEAAKLEEIASKHGLRLRRRSTLLWSKETIAESEAEMNAKTARIFILIPATRAFSTTESCANV